MGKCCLMFLGFFPFLKLCIIIDVFSCFSTDSSFILAWKECVWSCGNHMKWLKGQRHLLFKEIMSILLSSRMLPFSCCVYRKHVNTTFHVFVHQTFTFSHNICDSSNLCLIITWTVSKSVVFVHEHTESHHAPTAMPTAMKANACFYLLLTQ